MVADWEVLGSRLKRARVSTSVAFVIAGAFFGTFAARVPALKANAGLDDGGLGVALAGFPLGTVVAMQVSGRLIPRFGSSPVVVASTAVLAAAMLLPGHAGSLAGLFWAAVALGAGLGLLDVSMNAHAVTIEQGYGRSIMSAFHGFFSAGGLLGATAGGLAAHAGVGVGAHFAAAAAASVVTMLVAARRLLPAHVDAHHAAALAAGHHRVRWSKRLVLLGLITFCSFAGEGAAGDWSAVYVHDHLGTSSGAAAYPFAAFSLMMMVSRFLGDDLISRFGGLTLVRAGGLIAAAGLTTGLVVDSFVAAVIGWALLGVGLSSIAPVAFTTAGNLPGVAHGGALAKVAGLGYIGTLVAPPMIGAIAHVAGLRVGLFLPVALALVIVVAARPAIKA